MTVIKEIHEDHGAEFGEVGGRRVALHYGRPERAARAVRNGVGVTEPAYGVVVVEGEDRHDFVDNAVSNRVPEADSGCYTLLLDPQGGIETDMYVYATNERLLCFTPSGKAGPLAENWAEKIFIQDVDVREATDDFGVFGVHGPTATEKVASVVGGAPPPDEHLRFVRGSIRDAGVTVVRTDAPTGEEGYEVVCAREDATHVFDALETAGLSAAAFGYRTWEMLTIEAGTQLFDPDLEGVIPNVAGVRNALDFEKGCYVGQEVVSRVENRGRPSRRVVGLAVEAVPDAGAAVFVGDIAVGEVTRAVDSPSLEEPIAFARVAFDDDLDSEDVTVRIDGEEVSATRRELPFVEGSDRSARLPQY